MATYGLLLHILMPLIAYTTGLNWEISIYSSYSQYVAFSAESVAQPYGHSS